MHRPLIAGLFLLLAVPSWTHARLQPAKAVEAFNQGVAQFNAGQFEQAVALFDKAVESDASFTEAWYARAACKRNLRDPQGAISDLNQAIESNPGSVDGYALRGAIWYEQEQWDPALQDFDRVLKSRPHDAQALLGRGVIALRQEHLADAQRDLQLFLKLKPDDPLAPRLRKLLASMSQDKREAPSESNEPAARSSMGSRPASPATERLSQELFDNAHALSESYGEKVIRGQRAEAVGDIPAR